VLVAVTMPAFQARRIRPLWFYGTTCLPGRCTYYRSLGVMSRVRNEVCESVSQLPCHPALCHYATAAVAAAAADSGDPVYLHGPLVEQECCC